MTRDAPRRGRDRRAPLADVRVWPNPRGGVCGTVRGWVGSPEIPSPLRLRSVAARRGLASDRACRLVVSPLHVGAKAGGNQHSRQPVRLVPTHAHVTMRCVHSAALFRLYFYGINKL